MIVTTNKGLNIEISGPIRPCPFCSNPVSLIFDEFDGHGNHDHRKDTEGAIIECKNCKVHPKISTLNYDYETESDDYDKRKEKRKKWADKVREIVDIWNGNGIKTNEEVY